MTRTRTIRSIAISLILLSLLLIFSSVSLAETEVGRVTHLSGPLFAKKADQTTKVLYINSAVEQGDTLATEKKTYARIKFTDNSEISMRHGTQLKVSQYNFDQAKPQNVSAGQYVYVQTMASMPTILPGNPGIDFTLPTVIGDAPKEDGAKKGDPGCAVR
jgi:hypothetical protein